MILHVTEAKYLHDYVIWLIFNNGAIGEIFKPLKDKNEFKKFKVDKEIETVVWENGADMAPEFYIKT